MKRLTLLACTAALALTPGTAMASDASAAAGCNAVRYDGSSYVLFREGVKCKFARRWVRRLHKSDGQRKPKGWKCSSGSGYETGGQCTKGSKVFGWHPGD